MPVSAQAGYKPTVPQFSVQLVDTIFVTIENQPFTSYKDPHNCEHYLRYRVEIKGYSGGNQNWKTLFGASQSDSQYTTMGLAQYGVFDLGLNSLPNGSQLDFRVIAEIGYDSESTYVLDTSSGWSDIQTITKGETDSSSSLSQTTTPPPTTSNDHSQSQYPSQTQPPNVIFTNPLFIFGVGALLTGVVLSVLLMVFRRHIKMPTSFKISFNLYELT